MRKYIRNHTFTFPLTWYNVTLNAFSLTLNADVKLVLPVTPIANKRRANAAPIFLLCSVVLILTSDLLSMVCITPTLHPHTVTALHVFCTMCCLYRWLYHTTLRLQRRPLLPEWTNAPLGVCLVFAQQVFWSITLSHWSHCHNKENIVWVCVYSQLDTSKIQLAAHSRARPSTVL